MKKISAFLAMVAICFSNVVNAGGRAHTDEDFSSYSSDTVVKHMSINLVVDFDQKIFQGAVTYKLDETHGPNLVLDARQLDIIGVSDVTSGEKQIKFTLSQPDALMNQALTIPVQRFTKSVKVYYKTSPDSSVLSWMNPAQTKGGTHPFVFSMGESNHTRAWLPCQDTPRVRSTFDATIQTPNEYITAMMSAPEINHNSETNTYKFESKFSVPAYLIAIAAGNVEFKKLSERTGIYAEPGYINMASKEFEDMEDMIKKIEPIMGLYPWEKFNLLILPPSFPYSGMENPYLVYINPILMTGDKANADVVAHELSHFWSGNLVTNATWMDFWLNEGVTTYIENIVVRKVFGDQTANVNLSNRVAQLKAMEANAAAGKVPASYMKLKYDRKDMGEPDDAVNDVPYCKGSFFLAAIEHKVGTDEMYGFLKKYFSDFAFKSITTEQFLEYLGSYFSATYPTLLEDVEAHKWVYGTTVPVYPTVDPDLYAMVDGESAKWYKGEVTALSDLNLDSWKSSDWTHFFVNIPDSITTDQMSQISNYIHGSNVSNNAYVMRWWYTKVVAKQFKKDYGHLKQYLINNRISRFKFLYADLAATGKEGLAFAKEIFEAAKPGLHPAMVAKVHKILNPDPEAKK